VPVFGRDLLGCAQGPAAREDRHLVQRVDLEQQMGQQGVAGLVVGHDAPVSLPR
jgi:hypothetical protein